MYVRAVVQVGKRCGGSLIRMASSRHIAWVRDPNPTQSDADIHRDYSDLQLHGTSGDYCFCSRSPESQWKPNVSPVFLQPDLLPLRWSRWLSVDSDRSRHLGAAPLSLLKTLDLVWALVAQGNCIRRTLFYIRYSSWLEASGSKSDRRAERSFKLGKLFHNTVRNAKQL